MTESQGEAMARIRVAALIVAAPRPAATDLAAIDIATEQILLMCAAGAERLTAWAERHSWPIGRRRPVDAGTVAWQAQLALAHPDRVLAFRGDDRADPGRNCADMGDIDA